MREIDGRCSGLGASGLVLPQPFDVIYQIQGEYFMINGISTTES